jgi:tRNA(Arg) A34 adenosine deaminase TadA
MASDKKMLHLAAESALASSERIDIRENLLGAIGLRNDGVIVVSRNVSSQNPTPTHHAETRLLRKLTPNSEIWVARVKRNGEWGLSKPCKTCESSLRNKGISRIVYTIGPNEWGVLNFK